MVDIDFGLRFGWGWQSALRAVSSWSHWSQLLDGFCDCSAWVVVPGAAVMAFTNSNGLVTADNNGFATTDHDVLRVPHWKHTGQGWIYSWISCGTLLYPCMQLGRRIKWQIAWSRIWYIVGYARQGTPLSGAATFRLFQAPYCCIPILLLDLSLCSLTSPWNRFRIRNQVLL